MFLYCFYIYIIEIVIVNGTEYLVVNREIIKGIIFLTSVTNNNDLDNRYKWEVQSEMVLHYSTDDNETVGYFQIVNTGKDSALGFTLNNNSPKYKFNVTEGKLKVGIPTVIKVTVDLKNKISIFEDIIVIPDAVTSQECYTDFRVKIKTDIIDCNYTDYNYELVDDKYFFDVNFYIKNGSSCRGGPIKLENKRIDRGEGFIGDLYFPDLITLVLVGILILVSMILLCMRKKYNLIMKTQTLFLLNYSLGYIIFGVYSVIPVNNVCIVKCLFYQIGSVFMLRYYILYFYCLF